MKKKYLVVLTLLLVASLSMAETLKIGATPRPHAEILELIKPMAKAKGIEIVIVEFTDYVQPNIALADGELDANFFQHKPYLETFSKDRRLALSSLVAVHIEPMGAYSKKIKDLNELKKGASVGIPNDPTNGGRALLLLQAGGLIELDKKAGILPTTLDVVKNPLNLKFRELEAAMLPRSLQDLDLAIINTNYALEGGLVPTKDALIMEGSESPYANIIAVRTKDLDKPEFKILAEILTSEEVKEFLEKEYKGSIVAAF
ncbi:MAG TPA: MetQ/NlpA family ABC transporter substrate-binding protein [Firmicutes bacterium]|jgi:D-methionine transport system substrate-binding protein|nr:MetQ/NlpA family ABC transporter substrate-binding protein [Bacillota bacterium]